MFFGVTGCPVDTKNESFEENIRSCKIIFKKSYKII